MISNRSNYTVMKDCLRVVLATLLVVFFVACGKDDDKETSQTSPTSPAIGGGASGSSEEPGDDERPAQAFDSTGASVAVFSVAKGNTVRFSRGNLQYQASTDTWRFAEHQYDYIGGSNSQISSTYSGWIDLFGRGVWLPGKTPWHASTSIPDYAWSESETDAPAMGEEWRTLSRDDWKYLFVERVNASELHGEATVNGVHGIVMLPDEWTLPEGLLFTPGFDGSVYNDYSLNVYSVEQWQAMENAGAVFLPAAGDRWGTFVDGVNAAGFYWSSSDYGDGMASFLFFNGMNLEPALATEYSRGLSVRLVHR